MVNLIPSSSSIANPKSRHLEDKDKDDKDSDDRSDEDEEKVEDEESTAGADIFMAIWFSFLFAHLLAAVHGRDTYVCKDYELAQELLEKNFSCTATLQSKEVESVMGGGDDNGHGSHVVQWKRFLSFTFTAIGPQRGTVQVKKRRVMEMDRDCLCVMQAEKKSENEYFDALKEGDQISVLQSLNNPLLCGTTRDCESIVGYGAPWEVAKILEFAWLVGWLGKLLAVLGLDFSVDALLAPAFGFCFGSMGMWYVRKNWESFLSNSPCFGRDKEKVGSFFVRFAAIQANFQLGNDATLEGIHDNEQSELMQYQVQALIQGQGAAVLPESIYGR